MLKQELNHLDYNKLRIIMGGKQGKHSKKPSSDPKNLQMKDDYLKFLRREAIRREKEFSERVRNEEIIYN